MTLRRGIATVGPVVVAGLVFLGLWTLMANGNALPEYVLPAPSDVVTALGDQRDELARQIRVTLETTLVGFGAAIVVGVAIGTAIVYVPRMNDALSPYLVAGQVMPREGFAPLFLIWFGYGILPRAALAALICVFPIIMNTARGLHLVPGGLRQMMQAMAAPWPTRVFRVGLPFALPYIFAALRISVGLALVGSVTAEFIGGDSGIGQYIVFNANTTADISAVYAGLAVLTVTGLVLFGLVVAAERLCVRFGYGGSR